MEKKKIFIVAAIIFIFAGLMVFTFANPEEEEQGDDSKDKQKEVINKEDDTKEEEVEEETEKETVVDTSYDDALAAVKNAEKYLTAESYEAAMKLANKSSKNQAALKARLAKVKYDIDTDALVKELESKLTAATSKEDIDAAIAFRNDNTIADKVLGVNNSTLKTTLQTVLDNVNKVLDDTEAPVIDLDKTYYNTDVTINVTDANDFTIVLANGSLEENIENGQVITEEGQYTVTATDAAYNVSTYTFVIDKTAPVVNITYSTTAITNQNVIVRLIANEEIQAVSGYSISTGNTILSKTITENTETVEVTVKDLAGNETVAVYSVSNIDKTAPVVNVTYSTTAITNQNVIVRLIANEEIQAVSGYSISTGNTILSKTITDNTGDIEVVVKDVAGNETVVTYNVSNIDKDVPVVTASGSSKSSKKYSNTPIIVSVNEREVSKVYYLISNSYKDADKMTYTNELVVTKTSDVYTGTVFVDGISGSRYLYVKAIDVAGNVSYTRIGKFFIDTVIPTATFTYDVTEATNGNVVATLVPSENVTVTNNEGNTTYTFTENGEFTFEFTDRAGNVGTATAVVTNIDKVAPTIGVTGSSTSYGKYSNVPFTVTVNEEDLDKVYFLFTASFKEPNVFTYTEEVAMTESGEGVYTGTITRNNYKGSTKLYIKAVDKAGNISYFRGGNYHIDTLAPTAEVSYSTTSATNSNVTVTITANEELKAVTGWNLSSDKKVLTKEIDENTTEINELDIYDLAGNKSTILYEVTNIDKVAPVITVKKSSVGLNNIYNYIDFKITDNKDLEKAVLNGTYTVNKTGASRSLNFVNYGSHYVEGENKWVLYDAAGNTSTITFTYNPNLVVITNVDELTYALENQNDGQLWLIKEGNYVISRNPNIEYGGQTGWFFPLYKDNIKVEGVGNVTISADEIPDNGNWSSQDLIIIAGENDELMNITLGGYQNKAIEVVGDNAYITDVVINPYNGLEAGSIYIANTGITTTLKNVTLNKGRVTLSGADNTNTLHLINVNIDYAGGEYEEYAFPAFNDHSGATIDATNLTVSQSAAFSGNIIDALNMLPNNTTVNLAAGEYTIGSAELNKKLVINGHNATLLGDLTVNVSGTKLVELNVTSDWNNALVVNANNVKIHGGIYKTVDTSKQGEGTIRFMASETISLEVKNVTIYGGLYIHKYAGDLDKLIENVIDNEIIMEYDGTAPMGNIIFHTTEPADDSTAESIKNNNNLMHTQLNGYEVLIHDEGWEILGKVSF